MIILALELLILDVLCMGDSADIAQPVEHFHGKEGVRGSNPRVGSYLK